jgi:hypothetical protein
MKYQSEDCYRFCLQVMCRNVQLGYKNMSLYTQFGEVPCETARYNKEGIGCGRALLLVKNDVIVTHEFCNRTSHHLASHTLASPSDTHTNN